MRRSGHRIFETVLTAILAGIILYLTPFPIRIVFSDSLKQVFWVMALCVATPVTIAIRASFFQKRWGRILGYVVSTLVLPPCLLIFFSKASTVTEVRKTGKDSSFELISELSIRPAFYRLYRTNGGATTAYGLVMLKEKPIGFGLKSVRDIYSGYRVHDGSVSLDENGQLKLIVDSKVVLVPSRPLD